MILVLDTTRYGEIRVALYCRVLKALTGRFDGPVRGQLLTAVDELMRREREHVRALTGIVVAAGPGPFSALRSAAAVANALAYTLHVPIVGLRGALSMRELLKQGSVKLKRAKAGAPVVPFYGRKPNITRAPVPHLSWCAGGFPPALLRKAKRAGALRPAKRDPAFLEI